VPLRKWEFVKERRIIPARADRKSCFRGLQSCSLDHVLAGGTKSGYTFKWVTDGNTPSVGYSVTGTPAAVGTTGQRMFCSDMSGVIRFDPSCAGYTSTGLRSRALFFFVEENSYTE
jgi:hypothetical protein